MGHSECDPAVKNRHPWNLGRMVGAKRALKPRQVWAVRFWLDRERRLRDRAMLDLAIDSKQRRARHWPFTQPAHPIPVRSADRLLSLAEWSGGRTSTFADRQEYCRSETPTGRTDAERPVAEAVKLGSKERR